MDQVYHFFRHLFDPSEWPARWNCGEWSSFHGWLYIGSDIAIWAAYFIIPVFLFRFVVRKPDIPMPRIFWLFIGFILFCGATHLVDAIIFYYPAYRLSALLLFGTAVVSWMTVIGLFYFFPKAVQLRTTAEFDEELRRRDRLEGELRSARDTLEARARELEHKNRELEQFAYIASHDLQEPLRTITNYTGLLQRGADPEQPERERMALQYLDDSSRRMRELISGLLMHSRLGRNSNVESVDLNAIMEDVCADLQEAIRDNQATVAFRHLPTISGYPKELYTLFQNLMTNALKFGHDGQPTKVHIQARENEKEWEIRIEDNGIGIAPEYREKVFQLFKRLHGREAYPGIGIGLAHAKKIVELHNGNIRCVEPRNGTGAAFLISIPKTRA